MPVAFHILTTREAGRARGPKMNGFLTIMRGCQDVMGTLILGGVFERHPKLKVVCVEADAGWVPHYMYRMDHAYKRHRNWLPPGKSSRACRPSTSPRTSTSRSRTTGSRSKPSNMMNWRRLMWANDFPHSDSTWPESQELLAEHCTDLTPEQKRAILSDNVAQLFKIDIAALA